MKNRQIVDHNSERESLIDCFSPLKGTNEPTALVELKSIGFASKPKVVEGLTKYLDSKCNIPSARVGITLVDLVRFSFSKHSLNWKFN